MNALTLLSLLLAASVALDLVHCRTLTPSEIDLLQRILDDSRRELKPEEGNMVSQSDSPVPAVDNPLNDEILGFLRPENDFGCHDREQESCEEWKSKGYCEKFPSEMNKWCHKTCGCRLKQAPSPKVCLLSKFGCCWDDKNATGPNYGEGCPACMNKKTEVLCERMKGYCEARSSVDFMKENCAASCGFCDIEIK
uniref:Toxin candidate TRINITY_DN5935_c0_g1_i1 n=1 Tax=Isarachnanthus nocturnus TaxID=1240238 RepID=A0A7G7WZ40_9CNID|nr:toxin candidate TRINITY_DN5935_c0_g1_i1 [Isarachnanthus nocturnus]